MARRANLAAVIFLVPFVALLGWLSATSMMAVFTARPSAASVEKIESQYPVPREEARAAAAANLRAARYFQGGAYRVHAVRALFAAKLDKSELPSTERIMRASLSEAPMSPYGWMLQSYLRIAQGDVAGARRAWDMSVLVGRYVPYAMAPRLLVGMDILPHDHQIAGALVDQIRVLAKVNPTVLAQVTRQGGLEAPVRAALAGTEWSAAFERETKRFVQRAIELRKKQRGTKS